MSERDRIVRFIRETAALRKDLVQADDFGGPVTVELSGRELSGVTYALALAYIAEWLNGDNGHGKIVDLISEASAAVLVASSSEQVDEAIQRILTSAEADSDGGEGLLGGDDGLSDS